RTGSMPGQHWVDAIVGGIPPAEVPTFEGNLLRTIPAHQGPVRSVAFAAGNDGLVATAGTDNTVRIWDTMTGTNRVTIPNATWPVVLSADGATIATGSADFAVQ